MKSKILGLLAAGLLVSPAVSLANTTLTFEGLTAAPAEDITLNNQGYGGLTWNTGDNWTLWSSGTYSVPTVSGTYGLVNNRGLDPNIVSGTAFDFGGVSIIGWDFNAPSSVGIRAFDAGNILIGDTGLIGINTSTYTFFTTNFTGVNRLEFYGGQYFALDDFIIGRVPEPGTLALLGLGLLGLGATRRKAA